MNAELIESLNSPRRNHVLAIVGALILAGILFLLVPLTQILSNMKSAETIIREVNLVLPPPPKLPPPPEEEIQEEPEPELEAELQELSIQQLELSLNPGISDALSMGLPGNRFDTEVDVNANIQDIFKFDDLQSSPRILNAPSIKYPRDLIRKGIREGRVVMIILIDERGKAIVESVVSSTHRKLEEPAKKVVRKSRFTIPKVNGKPVKVRGKWPIVLKAP